MILLPFSFLFTVGCGKKSGPAGKYISEDNLNPAAVVVNLELTANGRGTWTTEEDNTTFEWEVRGGKIWLHTKSGGVIEGHANGDTILINLPGMAVRHFTKINQ